MKKSTFIDNHQPILGEDLFSHKIPVEDQFSIN